jgi:hypothetical protein
MSVTICFEPAIPKGLDIHEIRFSYFVVDNIKPTLNLAI